MMLDDFIKIANKKSKYIKINLQIQKILDVMKKKFGESIEKGKYVYNIYYENDEKLIRTYICSISHDIKLQGDQFVHFIRKLFGGNMVYCLEGITLKKTVYSLQIHIDNPRNRKKKEKCFYYHQYMYMNTKDLMEYIKN